MRRLSAGGGARHRVVIMVDTLEAPGGAERLAVENAVRLNPEKFERWLCITRWEDRIEGLEAATSLLARMSDAGVRVVKLRRGSKVAVWAWWPLLRLLRRERIDILHSHLFGSNVWAVILGRLAGVSAIVAHEHIWSYEGNLLRRLLDRYLIAPLSDAFVVVSEGGRRLMIEHEKIDPSDIIVMPNGIAAASPGDGRRVRAELGIAPDAQVVGSVGNLRPQKAFEVLIEAAVELRRQVPGVRVLVAGEGSERTRLEQLIAARGLEGTVMLLGARSDIPNLLAAFDVAVCCSDFEGSPLAVMEYMQAALPVAATRIEGLAGLVLDGQSGVLVAPRDSEGLAEALVALLGDPDLRARLGQRGEDLWSERWRLETWIGRIEDLYEDLLANRRH